MTQDSIRQRNNVQIVGDGDHTVMLAHGFGCDQNVWRRLVPALAESNQLLLFDYVGWGNSQLSAFSVERYSQLEGYAQDVIDICEAYNLAGITFVGHSVSAVIGLIAALQQPARFRDLVMVCPSPCYLDDPPDYIGGFSRDDLTDLLNLMDKNYIGWANHLAPRIMGGEASDELTGELSGSFCSTDPIVSKVFAKAAFLSDHRHLLPDNRHPCLLLQSRSDELANPSVGEYMHRHIPDSRLRVLDTDGHCIHMTRPEVVAAEIRDFLARH